MVEIDSVVLDKWIMYFNYGICLLSPLDCFNFPRYGQNWPCGSLEEAENDKKLFTGGQQLIRNAQKCIKIVCCL